MGLFTTGGLLIAAFVALPILALLVAFGWIIRRNNRRVAAAASWPSVPGTVLSSFVERRRSASAEGGYTHAFYPIVEYAYAVGGKSFAGRRIFFGQEIGAGGPRMAERIAARFPAGARVAVFYDPADPSKAVLDRSAPGNKFWWLVVAIVAAAFVFVAALMIGLEIYIGGALRSAPR